MTIINEKNDFTLDYSKYENVSTKLKEIAALRSKGKFDAVYHARLLTYILENCKDTGRYKAEVLIFLVGANFDVAKGNSNGFMNREQWVATRNLFKTLVELLETNQIKDLLKNFQNLTSISRSEVASVSDANETDLSTFEFEKSILPSIANFVEKLASELMKAF